MAHAKNPSVSALMEMISQLMPELDEKKHKGEAGMIGVIGGSEEYTGAPYFAAITSMKVGADQTHVFCAKNAAVVIKNYSPDLIVHPTLDQSGAEKAITELFGKVKVLIIGPGLGRDNGTLKTVKNLICKAKENDMPMVIDADGLWLINQQPDVIKGYSNVVLTPNAVEAKRLWKAAGFEEDSWNANTENVRILSQSLGNVGIIVKGQNDLISDGNNDLESSAEYGLKRCGGQGDVMSGALGTFLFWAHLSKKDDKKSPLLQSLGPLCCAAYAASVLTRRCSKLAFEELGRSMLASDMISKIPRVIKELQGRT